MVGKVTTSERRGASWRWPDPDREVKINPTFAKRYPSAAALAREMGLNVSYACKIYHAYGDFSASKQLTGYRTHNVNGRQVPLTDADLKLMPLKVLTKMQEARQEEGTVRERYLRALDELRMMEYRPRFISERHYPNGDSCSLWFPFTMYSMSIALHGYGKCEADGVTREECVAFLEVETPA